MRALGRGVTAGVLLGLGLAGVAVGCSSGGSAGGAPSGARCQTGQQSCVRLEDCPALSCSCPGIRFPVTIQRCSGGCCPQSCDEACPSGAGGAGSGGAAGSAGQATTSYGQEASVEWLAVAGSQAIERVERVAVSSDGKVAALAEMPQGAQTVFNAGQANELTASGRALVISYRADGSLDWVVPLSAGENLFPGSVAFGRDGGVIASGTFKHGGSTQPYELTVGDGAGARVFSFPRPADDLYLPFVVAFDAAGALRWVKIDGGGVLLTDANRVLAVGTSLTTYDYDGNVVSQRKLVQAQYAYQAGFASAAWMPGGGFVAAGAFSAAATLEPGTPSERPLVLTGNTDGIVTRYAADGSFLSGVVFPEASGVRRDVVDIGVQPDRSVLIALRRTPSSTNNGKSYIERLDASDQLTWSRTLSDSPIYAASVVDGAVYVGGTINSRAEFPVDASNKLDVGTADGASAGYIARYTASGGLETITLLPGTTTLGLAAVNRQTCVVGGDFSETATFGSSAGAPQRSSVGSTDLFVARVTQLAGP